PPRFRSRCGRQRDRDRASGHRSRQKVRKKGHMAARRSVTVLVAAVIALITVAVAASAQITTGTISGTVKDAQGAVVPGAAVTLISDTRGTRLPDVFTNANGDFTLINVSPDDYTIQVAMSGFKTLKRSGIGVSVGDRLELGAFTL